MKFRNLGRTGVKVSVLCLGCMNFGGRTNEMDSIEIIKDALDVGINFIDTANVYGHDPDNYQFGRGRSEQIVGKALKEMGHREQVILATKVHFPISKDPNAQGNSRRHIIDQCTASLKRLQTEYIDLYQLHHPSSEIPIDETLRALDDLIHRGWVHYIGTSTFAAWQLVESLWVSKEYGLNRFISEQPVYHLLDRRIERELVPMAQTYGIALMTWSPLAGGFLTGRYRRNEPIPPGSRYDVFWKSSAMSQFTDKAFDIVEEVERLSTEKGCSPAQLALAWVLHQPGITSVIIGPRTREQLEDCLGALEISLNKNDLEYLDNLALPGRVTVPFYGVDGLAWTAWGPHLLRW
ncbi:MAG: aldo/keto reductase [Candidatus Hodarchaeota archaeon]